MALSLGILFGIIAMIGWGVADFFAAKAVRKSSVFKTYFWIQAIGLVIYLLIFLLFFKLPAISLMTFALIVICAFIGITTVMSFYKGLQVGIVSIISPIGASYAVVTVILSLIFLNETITSFQAVGISLVILGAILTSFKFHDLIRLKVKNIAAGVKYAVFAMLGWGVLMVLIDVLVADLGWFLPILFIVAVEIFYLLAYSGAAKKSISFPKNIALFVILAAVLEVIAFLSFGFSITSENVAIVAPIISAFPAITIILARIFFKEILELNQRVGILAIISGLILLAL
ncbi:MAG: DMT family transporter [Candidatus Woesearchaeota archaeon]